jgi:hypothetical protein
VEIFSGIPIKITKDTILDLNGYSITNDNTSVSTITVAEGGALKIIDTSQGKTGSIVTNNPSESTPIKNIDVTDGGTVTIYGGNIKGKNSAIYMRAGATVTIKGGTFENLDNSSPVIIKGTSTLHINGGEFSAQTKEKPMISIEEPAKDSTVIINSGTFGDHIVSDNFKDFLIDNRTNNQE